MTNFTLVTYIDGNEFLVNTTKTLKAVREAINVNINKKIMGDCTDKEEMQMLERTNYTTTKVDWELFNQLMKKYNIASVIDDVAVLKFR